MKMRCAALALVVAASMAAGSILPVPAWANKTMSCGSPLEAQGEWQTASPEAAGFDSALLCSLGDKLENSPALNVHAVVVVRSGKLVYETYRTGEDQRWGTGLGLASHTPQTLHDVRSVSKSVVSLLVGIALDRKLVASINTPVFSYFPELAALRTPEKDRIELRHLLAMTSGLAWDERRPYSDPENSERRMTVAANPYRFALEPPVVNAPGEKWNYNGGNTQLLAGVLERSAGMWLTDFASEELFVPLGIKQFEWLKMWANGDVAAAYGLRLRPRDMAKLGQLVLDKGLWNGRRIVSEAWIRESMQPWADVAPPLRYGYQWWIDEGEIAGRKISWFSAQGLGGQRIYIVPALGLVVVITAGLYESSSQDWVSFDIFEKFVLAAIRK
jgi:CubicO group peptidase (beta-lactamase class C family)